MTNILLRSGMALILVAGVFIVSSVNGVYLILDTRTGNQYIGSAYGNDGIWQKWS